VIKDLVAQQKANTKITKHLLLKLELAQVKLETSI
jgi:hypothetical protein